MSLVSKCRWSFGLAVSLLAVSAGAEPRKVTHVACVGDSITQGSGSSDASKKSYPAQLQALYGDKATVKNFGVSGRTMLSNGDNPYQIEPAYVNATNFVKDAPQGSLVSVVIILGANDSKPFNWEPDAKPKNDQQYLTDYREMVDHFLALPSKPVVYVGFPLATGNNPCCSIRGNVIHDEQIPLIKQVAMEKHVPIIDLNTPTTGHPEYFPDGVHPDDAGYAVMAALVKAGLEREPTVSITSPAMGAMPAAGMLSLAAMASADTVDISSVEFFEGAASLGKATAAPFMLNWQATVGPHTITATATDATLATKTSEAVTFTVKDAAIAGAGGTGGAMAGAGGAAAGASGLGGAGTSGMATGGSAGTSAGAGSGTAGAGPASEDDGGCGCAVPGSSGSARAGWLLVALAAFASRRRRALRPTA